MSTSFALSLLCDPYAQRRDWTALPWLDAFARKAFQALPGASFITSLRMRAFVLRVHSAARQLPLADGQALQQEIAALRKSLRTHGFRPHLCAKSFALIRHLSQQTLGVSHFDSQIQGAWVLLSGRLAEMATGEGKTLTATLAAATAALAGIPVHVVTVNDYLARRDHGYLSPLYHALGLTTGLVTEDMDQPKRRAQYRSDIVYCSNKTIVFDYLRDRARLGARMAPLAMSLDRLVQCGPGDTTLRGLHFAIVDEADSVFIDEARTPLILSGAASPSGGSGGRASTGSARTDANPFALSLSKGSHQRLGIDTEASTGSARTDANPFALSLSKGSHQRLGIDTEASTGSARTGVGEAAATQDDSAQGYVQQAIALASQLQVPHHAHRRPDRPHMVLTPEGRAELARQAQALGPLWQAPLRRQETIEQALDAIHLYHRDVHYILRDGKVVIVDENTGRVMPDRSWEQGLHQLIEAKEGVELSDERRTVARISYQLFFRRYLRLAGMTGTCREVASEVAEVYGLGMVRVPTRRPLRRRRLPTQLHASAARKWQAVAESILQCLRRGQPVLVGTRSILASEQLSRVLDGKGIAHQVLNAKQDAAEAAIVARAGEVGAVTIATSMAGRGTDIAPPAAALKAGGLHVILTERHDNARVDRQLIGRCARQGEPGSCEWILSMEDEVVSVVRRGGSVQSGDAPERAPRGWMARLLHRWLFAQPHSPLPRWIGLAYMRLAQLRIEHQHGQLRRRLLGADFQNRQSLSFSGQME